jgi:hypothetical protein
MTFFRLNAIAALVAASIFSLHAQTLPPNTGIKDSVSGNDLNWWIDNSTVTGENPVTATMQFLEAFIVPITLVPNGWATPLPGSRWIAPCNSNTRANGF